MNLQLLLVPVILLLFAILQQEGTHCSHGILLLNALVYLIYIVNSYETHGKNKVFTFKTSEDPIDDNDDQLPSENEEKMTSNYYFIICVI